MEPRFQVTRHSPVYDRAAFQRAMAILEHRLTLAVREALIKHAAARGEEVSETE